MKALIVGAGALGGLIAARLLSAGRTLSLATRNRESAAALKTSGLHLTGVGSDVLVDAPDVAPLEDYLAGDGFDLVVLATKAHDAIELAPQLASRVRPGGALLPVQNGGVSQLLADRIGGGLVLGGLSNFGVTMIRPGFYEQRNAGNLLIGELTGGSSDRAERVCRWLRAGIDVGVTPTLRAAIGSKLLLNCSVTTIGAVAGRTMRQYIGVPEGRELFDRAYDEALSVALADGIVPQRMIVDPIPPNWNGRSISGDAHDAWLGNILDSYGDLKASMLQDLERGRTTEIDFINGYVVNLGRRLNVPTPHNAAIVEMIHAIERGEAVPDPTRLGEIVRSLR